VSVFAPSARVTDPHGREWEIYAFRIRLPERPPHGDPVGEGSFDYRMDLFAQAFGVIIWLMVGVFRLFVRLVVDLPVAAVKAYGSDQWTIEAVSWAPFESRSTWTTTSEYRGQVLAQVEGGLARGDTTPRPRNAQLVRAY
jgi:hypothetical protein